MLETAVASMPNARQFENIIGGVFAKIQEDFHKPKAVNNLPQKQLELQEKKQSQDYEIKKEQNALKRGEFSLKALKELNN